MLSSTRGNRGNKEGSALMAEFVMPGLSRPRTASLTLAYVPGIHVWSHAGQKDVDGRDEARP
jgi:hypothetical protein